MGVSLNHIARFFLAFSLMGRLRAVFLVHQENKKLPRGYREVSKDGSVARSHWSADIARVEGVSIAVKRRITGWQIVEYIESLEKAGARETPT